MHSDFELLVTNPDGSRSSIKQEEVATSKKTLGIYDAPSGGNQGHLEYILRIRKKNWATVGRTEMIEYTDKVLKPIKCLGLNPYKIVEMFKNYRPVVPVGFHSDELYGEPSPEVWSKVKVE